MAKIKNFNYSFQRHNSKQEMEEELKHDDALRKKLKDLYEKSMDSVQSDIDRELSFLSSKENVSLADALQRINKLDVERFSRIIKRWVEEKDKTDLANKWSRRYNVTMRTNRLELLNAYIGIAMEQLANEEEKITTEYLEKKAMRVYSQQAGILGNSVPTVKHLNRASEAIVKGSFNKTHFSERIWSNSAELQNDLMSVVRRSLIQGKHPLETAKELRKHVKASFIGDSKTKGRNAKYVAERLAVTEATFLQTEIQKQNYLQYGVEDYEYKVELNPCPICQGLSGKFYKVADMTPGLNAPPMHPWCKCTTSPLTDRLRNKKESEDGSYQSENENSNRRLNKDVRTNHSLIKSSEFDKKIDNNFDEIKNVKSIIKSKIRQILVHRDGTLFEDLIFIDSKSGRILESVNYESARKALMTKPMKTMLSENKPYSIIAIHNHPNSSVPSFPDIMAAKSRKYKYGIIAGHNGIIYKYEVDEILNIDRIVYESFVVKLEKQSYNESGLNEFIDNLKSIGIRLEVY